MTGIRSRPGAATGSGQRRSAISLAAVAVCCVALGALVVLARQGGVAATRTVWAEDGTIFLQQASDAPLPEVVGHTYAGYLHVVPRLLTQPATWLPMSWADTYLAFTAALVAAVLAVTVFLVLGQHISSRPVRIGYAAVLLLVPVSQDEVLANVANLHWWFILAGFWVLLWRPQHAWSSTLGAAVVALAVLSDPLTLLLAPVALARVRWKGRWWLHLPEAALAAGGALAIVGAAVAGEDRDFEPLVNPVRLVAYYAKNVVVGGVWGARASQDVSSATLALWAAASLPVLVLAGLLVWRVRRRGVARWCLLMSVVFYVVPVALTGVPAPRYALVPVLLLYGAVAVGIDEALADRAERQVVAHRSARGLWRWAAVALLVPVAVLAWNFRPTADERTGGPYWDPGLARAQAGCTQGGAAAIPITPDGWTVSLDCAVVRR